MQDGLWEERRGLFHDLRVVKSWLASRQGRLWKWSFATLFCVYVALVAVLAIWDPDLPTGVVGTQKERTQAAQDQPSAVGLLIVLTPLVLLAFSTIAAVTFKAQLIRLDRRLEVKHAAHYRSRLMREFADKTVRMYEEQEEWRAKTQAELYETILDQVERGILKPRPKPPEDNYDFPDRDY